MTNTQLAYLVAVDRHGSFSEAAAHCFVTQPTLSMQIQKLEGELGVTLFDRRQKPVQATPLGRQVIDQAYRALEAFKGIETLVREQRETLSGELRLGIIPTLGPYLLPRFLPAFLADHPEVRVTVRELLTADIVDSLRRDGLDVGIAATPLGIAGISETALFYEPFTGLVARGHRLAAGTVLRVEDVAAEEMMLVGSGHCLHTQVQRLCARGAAPDAFGGTPLRFVGGSLEAVVRVVAAGHGVTLLPELAVRDLPADLLPLLRPLRPPVPARAVSLITHGEGIRTRLLDHLRRSILKAVPDGLKNRRSAWRVVGAA